VDGGRRSRVESHAGWHLVRRGLVSRPAEPGTGVSYASRIQDLAQVIGRPVRLMEVCGTHTMVAFRSGLRSLLPANVALISGPGCPVCVTPGGYIDAAVELSARPGVTVATFGDLVRVPGSASSLERERAKGAAVEVVYSPTDALALARQQPERVVVFLAVGFETTAPGIAVAVRTAHEEGLTNFMILCALKTMPGPMRALAGAGEVAIDGFICPGHVSVITGASAFSFLAGEYGLPCVVTGFEDVDLIKGVEMLLQQVAEGRSVVEIEYSRAVDWDGNRLAQQVVSEVFEPCDSEWRGLGVIPGSGLALGAGFDMHDAARRFDVSVSAGRPPTGCRCGDILRGVLSPPECPLFDQACTPGTPVGPCMVSSEGACAAFWRYGRGGAS
jgi:hydrogenase expression/formation protein HypD